MYYIRFTTDIYKDIKRGYSRHMGGKKLLGLCAWNIIAEELNENSDKREILEAAKSTAQTILENTYGSYSDNSEYAVLEGRYVGSSNDGVCIKVIKVISIESLT